MAHLEFRFGAAVCTSGRYSFEYALHCLVCSRCLNDVHLPLPLGGHFERQGYGYGYQRSRGRPIPEAMHTKVKFESIVVWSNQSLFLASMSRRTHASRVVRIPFILDRWEVLNVKFEVNLHRLSASCPRSARHLTSWSETIPMRHANSPPVPISGQLTSSSTFLSFSDIARASTCSSSGNGPSLSCNQLPEQFQ